MSKKLLQGLIAMLVIASMVASCAPAQPQAPAAEAPAQAAPATPATEAPTAPTEAAVQAPTDAEMVKEGGTLTVIIRLNDYESLDPHFTSLTQANYIYKNIYDKLLYLEGKEKYLGLATSIESNEDFTEWTIGLRNDVTFHDGSKFNAEVAAFNFDRMVDPATQSKMAVTLMGPYDRSEVVDEYTVKVYFKEPFALFENSLTSDHLSMISKEAVEKFGSDKFFENPVGTGPFKYVSQISATEVVMEKNPDYNWAPAFFSHQGPPHLDKVIWRFIIEDEARIGALETGEADIVDTLPPTRVEELKAAGYQVHILPRYGLPRMANLNTKAFPTDDVRVRKAMNYAFNHENLEKMVTKGIYPPAHNVFANGTPFYDEKAELYEFNPAKGIELLEEAGWTEVNAEGYRVKDGKVLEILYYTFADSQAELTAEVFQNEMKQIGMKVNVEVVPGNLLYSIANEGSTVNASFIGTGAPDPAFPARSFWHSDGKGTRLWSQFDNAEVDALINAGLATNDPVKRQEAYSKLQYILMDNAVVVPLSNTMMLWALQSDVRGFRADGYPHPYMYDIWLDR